MEFLRPRDFQKYNPNPGPHPTSLTMIYLYPPLMARFSLQRCFFIRQKRRVMLLTTVSAGAIVHSLPPTNFKVKGRFWAVAVAEEHVMMALASASSKLRAYIMMLTSALARTTREDVSDARDLRWQQWQQDRCIAAAVAMGTMRV
jgi:hypothetical protein